MHARRCSPHGPPCSHSQPPPLPCPLIHSCLPSPPLSFTAARPPLQSHSHLHRLPSPALSFTGARPMARPTRPPPRLLPTRGLHLEPSPTNHLPSPSIAFHSPFTHLPWPSIASHSHSIASHSPSIASHSPSIAVHRLPLTFHRRPSPSTHLPSPSNRLPIAFHRVPITVHRLPSPSFACHHLPRHAGLPLARAPPRALPRRRAPFRHPKALLDCHVRRAARQPRRGPRTLITSDCLRVRTGAPSSAPASTRPCTRATPPSRRSSTPSARST